MGDWHGISNRTMLDRFDKWWGAQEKQMEEEAQDQKCREMSREQVSAAQRKDPECRKIDYPCVSWRSSFKAVKNDAGQCVISDEIDLRPTSFRGDCLEAILEWNVW